MEPGAGSRPLMTIVTEIFNDIPRLLGKQVELLRAEVAETSREIGHAGLGIATGLLLSVAALLILLQALVLALAEIMPAWLAAVAVGVPVAIIGLAMVLKGQSDLKSVSLAPRRTLDQMNENAQMVKEKVT
jgi:Putative Actinobacterial Holin-X, holin superfamily III